MSTIKFVLEKEGNKIVEAFLWCKSWQSLIISYCAVSSKILEFQVFSTLCHLEHSKYLYSKIDFYKN